DPALYQARVNQMRANKSQSVANLKQAEADLVYQKAKLTQYERDWERAQRLVGTGAVSGLDFDTARANYETGRASVVKGDATVVTARAAIEKADADLKEAETNLGYATITSPVKGVIIDRRVNIGQTVVAALNAPSLFLIAKDLTRMEVWAQVNEADIGAIKIGQTVRFTVDGYPGRVFQGKVIPQGRHAPRLNANMTQNVVTYTLVVSYYNSDGLLLPYLTANLQFVVNSKSDALLVPNAALRWRPLASQVAPDLRDAFVRAQKQRRADSTKGASAAAEKD